MTSVEEEVELPDIETMRQAQEEAYELLDEAYDKQQCVGVQRDATIVSFDTTGTHYVYTLRLPTGEHEDLLIEKPTDITSTRAFRDFMEVVGEPDSDDPTAPQFNTIPVTYTTENETWKADVKPLSRIARVFASKTRRKERTGKHKLGKGAFLPVALTLALCDGILLSIGLEDGFGIAFVISIFLLAPQIVCMMQVDVHNPGKETRPRRR